MATADQLARLDEAHRAQQAVNAGALLLALNQTWEQVRPTALAATGTAWLAEAIALIVSRRRMSSLYALDYTRRIRLLQLGTLDDAPAVLLHDFPTLIREWETVLGGRARGRGAVDPLTLPDLPGVPDANLEQIRESLIHVALRETAMRQAVTPDKRPLLTPGAAPAEDLLRENETIRRENDAIDEMMRKLMPDAAQRAGAAGVRHVQNGGRDAGLTVVKADLKARGFIRVTRPGCCFFCAMLASRGPVYKEDSFFESDRKRKDDPRDIEHGTAKVHDGCGCHLRAVYTRDGSEWTTVARESSDIWEDIRREKGRTPSVNDFRTRWDARNASMQ